MAIVIKEIIVKTTVEHQAPQWSAQLPEETVKKLKQEILAEMSEYSRIPSARKERKNR